MKKISTPLFFLFLSLNIFGQKESPILNGSKEPMPIDNTDVSTIQLPLALKPNISLLPQTVTAFSSAMTFIPKEIEPNETSATAMPLNGTDVKIRGNLFPNGDIDFYSFQANAGDKVYAATMTSFSSGNSTDSQLTLLASDGTTVIEFDDDNGSFAATSSSIAGATIPTNGTYYIKVNDFTAGTKTERSYDLYLKVQSASGSPTAEVEANDTPGTANVLPANGWVSGARNPATASEQDWYSVTLNAGETLFISLDLDPERDGTTWNGRLGIALFGDASNQIIVVDDAGTGDVLPTPNKPSEALFFTVKTSGTYFVFVDSATGATGGPTATYNLSVSKLDAPTGYTTYASTDVPKTIGPEPTDPVATSTITIPDTKIIKDIRVNVVLNHALMADIDAILTSPEGNKIALFTDIGAGTAGGQSQMDINFGDFNAIPPSFAVLKGMALMPKLGSKLDQLRAMKSNGVWTLELHDDATANGGTLTSWSIDILEEPLSTQSAAYTSIYNENFEASDGGFTHSGTGDQWARGTPATVATSTLNPVATFNSANSGVNCFKTNLTGTYNTSTIQYLKSPAINLSAVTANVVMLSWAMKYQMENASFDHFTVTVQEVGGANPKEVFVWLGATQTTNAVAINIPMSSGWGTYYADVSEYKGKTIEIIFHLDTDGTVNFGGVAIDDVSVKVSCTIPVAPTITPPPSLIVCSPSTLTLTATCATGTVTWSNAATGTALTLSAVGTYSISATCSDAECTSVASSPVTVLEIKAKPAAPTITAPAITSVCSPSTLTLTATCATGTVTWSNAATGTTLTLSAFGTYSITATCTDNGCTSDASSPPVLLQINSTPIVSANAVQNFCNAAPQWLQVASLPGNPRDMAASFSIGNKIYIMGGTNGLPDFWEFDTNTNTWTQKANYPEGANYGALGLSVNGKGYIIGGHDNSYKKSVNEYNPANNTWTQKADIPGNARAYMIGFVIGNKIYAGAGLADGSKDFYEFDPLTNVWTQKADFANGTRVIFFGASFSDGNFGYAGLGFGNGDTQTTDFWKYNATNNIWTQVANFPGGGRVAPTSSGNNSFGIVGSGSTNGNLTNDFYKYNYTNDSWTQILNFTSTARYRSSGLIVDGNFYFGLGYDGALKNDFWKLTMGGTTTVANLVATGTNLKWYDAATGGNLLPNTTVIATGTYYVSQTVNTCESERTAVNVTVNALPIAMPTITPPAILSVCSPNTLTLTASCPVGTVTWSNAATGTSLTLSAVGTYAISATCVINTCSSDVSPAVSGLEINSIKSTKPSIIPGSSTICNGASITLIAICPNSKINWTGGATGSAITVSPTTTTQYRVSCTTVGHCPSDSSDAAIITVRPKPITPTISTTISTICVGNSTTLTATGCDGSFSWTGGLTGTIIMVSPTVSKNYKVLCTTIVGCKSDSSAVTTINVNAIPNVPTVSIVYITPNVSASLTATCSSGTPVWYGTANGTISLASGSYLTPILNANTTYYVACESNVGGNIATNPQNCVSPRASQQVIIDDFDITQNPTLLFVCGLQNASFSISAAGLSITYQWQENRGSGWNNVNNGGVYVGATSAILNIIPAQVSMNNYNYRCVVTNTITSQIKTSNEALLIVTAAALAQNLIMVSPIMGITSTFQAIQTILATNKISSNARIEYFAGNSITLSTGFEVSTGSIFKAKIQTPCTNTSNPIPETLEK